ncbi:MAG: hypothetical protein AB1898_32560 [Acidobacteriota bacterium]
MHQQIYERLLGVARAGGYVTYTDIAPMAGLDMGNQADRNEIGRLLGEISTHEHNQGRPLLSVVVIHRDNNMPGQGFFELARDLNVYHGRDDLLFFIEELRRVHEYWRQN